MNDEGLNTGMLGELDRKNARIAALEAEVERYKTDIDFKEREICICKEQHRLELENLQLNLEREISKMPQSQTPYLDKVIDIFTSAAEYEKQAEKKR